MFLRLLPVLLATLVLARPIAAQQALTDVDLDADKLAESISTLAELRTEKKNAFLAAMRQRLAKPINEPGSAGNFIIDCIREVRFEGKPDAIALFAVWKKENRALLSDHDFETAANLHLRYLAMTLRRAMVDSNEPMQEEVWQYLAKLDQSQELLAEVEPNPRQVRFRLYDQNQQTVVNEMVGEMEDVRLANAMNVRTYVRELINGDVTAGLAAQAMKLGGHIGTIAKWERDPGNFSGIMEQNIRTYLREKKDPRITATWDYEIKYLSSVAALPKNIKTVEKFWKEDYPRLIWRKSQDVKLVGMPNRALLMQMDLARQFADHADFDTWAKAIGTALQDRKKALAAQKAGADGSTPPSPGAPATGTVQTVTPNSPGATP
jgi:hypothetical protein